MLASLSQKLISCVLSLILTKCLIVEVFYQTKLIVAIIISRNSLKLYSGVFWCRGKGSDNGQAYKHWLKLKIFRRQI